VQPTAVPGARGGKKPIRALILTPTRELAAQVEESVRIYGKYSKLTSMVMFGVVPVLMTYLPVTIISSWIGNWLFYVQHCFEHAYWERGKEWDSQRAAIEGSSFYDLPRVAHWFTGNIGYHHIHHLAPRIPNYRLRAAHEALPSLKPAVRMSLLDSFACARMKLWDESLGRMVGFDEADHVFRSAIDVKGRPADNGQEYDNCQTGRGFVQTLWRR